MTTVDATIGAQVQQAAVTFSSLGDNVVVLGVAGKIIKVLQFFFVIGGAANITFKSGSTAITGSMPFSGAGAFVLDYAQLPLNCLNAGDSFVVNLSAGVAVGGTIWYAQ